MTTKTHSDDRNDGVLIAGATLAALFLMLHHPTSASGAGEDGHLLSDWSNSLVHGAMIACLIALSVGLDGVRHRIGEQALLTRAGAILIGGGFLALAGAALVSGFATGRLVAQTTDPAVHESGSHVLWALNQSLTSLGSLLVAAGAAAWAPRIWGLGVAGKASATLGVGMAGLAVWWNATDGGFGLIVAATSLAVFALWSLSVAAVMLTGTKGDAQ
ncbi:hypothetical protein [Brevundimonas bacteroides]|uniref:hypothetical protein n=1 Tax=Brevundimonas bacteroides TaxID=74311 RepID=UPI000495E63B|nr:hypothetical protein [Brevundimonas bacteroides]